MKKLRDYEIGLIKLSNKKHEINFDVDDSFFALFEQEMILGGKMQAKVELDKTESLLIFNFDIKGHVRLTCDRSLDEFDQPVDIQETFHVKYGPENAELDEDLWQITNDTQSLNVAQHIYDFIGLSLPMKKLHPRFLEAADEEEDAILIYSSKQAGADTESDDSEDGDIDPRWDALKNLN